MIESLVDFLGGNLQLYIVAEVCLAIVLGGIIGYERETVAKPAGFRTHMLVAGAAALLVGMGDIIVASYSDAGYDQILRADPIRIVEAVVTGISFLGAGTIFRGEGRHVEGLTTAASLLFSGAVGMAVAFGQYLLALSVTLLAVVVLRGIHWVERRINR